MACNILYTSKNAYQSGNVLLIILLAVFLIGALTVAIQGTKSTTATIDKETLLLRTTEVKRYAAELERGIAYILQNGVSEADLRFANPDAHTDYGNLSADADPKDQMFHKLGGGVTYRPAPSGVNDGSKWEFYGDTALPEVGSDEADLIAVLPNVSAAFCEQINKSIGYTTGTQPQDTGTCLNSGAGSRFDNGTQFSGSPNTLDENSFSKKPAPQACVRCAGSGQYHYYAVLLAR